MADTGIDLSNLSCLRRMPIDWHDISCQSGLRAGTLTKNSLFGWGVRGKYLGDVDFACIDAPELRDGETLLRVEGNEWAFYGPNQSG